MCLDIRFLLRLGLVPMMTGIITSVLIGTCLAGGIFILIIITPILYAAAIMQEEDEKETIANNLKIARTNKILADQEVLESRRAKLDSEVAILELRIEKKRRDLGMDQDFKPTNY